MSLYWYIAKDFLQLFRYNKNNLLSSQKLTFKKALLEIIVHKTWYTILILVIPLLTASVSPWLIVAGFLLMHFITGLLLALIFQPAHVVNETAFYKPEKTLENNPVVHQLKTTANFATNSRVFSWLIGGLNFQIEHHLFPAICHVHYRKLSQIVKKQPKSLIYPTTTTKHLQRPLKVISRYCTNWAPANMIECQFKKVFLIKRPAPYSVAGLFLSLFCA